MRMAVQMYSVIVAAVVAVGGAPNAIASAIASKRDTPFVRHHPHHPTKGWRLASGEFIKSPFRVYDSDMTIVLGLADLKQVQALAGNSRYQPTVIIKNGKQYASVRLYFVDSNYTDAGPYREFILAFDSQEQVSTIPFVNLYSLLIPFALPTYRIFLDELVLSEQLPVDLGVEAWGLDKKLGQVTIDSTEDVALLKKKLAVKTASGQRVIAGSVEIDRSQPAILAMVSGMLEAFNTKQLPLPPPDEVGYAVGQVNRHVHTGQVSLQDDALVWQPIIVPYKGTLVPGKASAFGKKLERLKFVPYLTISAPGSQFTVADPEPAQTR